MTPRTLEKLEWPQLLANLAGYAQTHEGHAQCLAPRLDLRREEIEERWREIDPLRRLAQQSYRAPIGELAPLAPLFRAATLGQVLGGSELRQIASLLESTRKVSVFSHDLSTRCATLKRFKASLYPMPALASAINRAIGPDGELLDDASEELTRIRRNKMAARKRIEEAVRKLLHDAELIPYLQDDFFTVRSERYVVPMRLDGRGRVKGSILDTSSSGQTLFIEPAAIVPLNDQLQELELEEKLEILRIFRELSAKVAADAEALARNYDELVTLDRMTAEAVFAADIDAGPVELSDRPILELRDARHPLLSRAGSRKPIGNTILLAEGQRSLIISGPNAGGKTVVLKTVGLLHLMARAGLLIPAAMESKLYLFREIWLEMGDAQSLSANLSTFSGHLLGLKPILEEARAQDLTLLDELAVGTDPQTAAAIGTAILEQLAARGTTTLVTTHFDALKGLAVADGRFRNGSMEFSLRTLHPTYRLILDVPGQSYGLEVAEQMGLPGAIITRAKELRGGKESALDQAVTALMQARDDARRHKEELEKEKLDAEAEKTRWEQEVELLREQRRKTAQQLADKYEDKLSGLRTDFDDLVKQLRQTIKDVQKDGSNDNARELALATRRAGEKALRDMDGAISELTSTYAVDHKLPGTPATSAKLAAGTPVWVLPLKKAGRVLKPSNSQLDPVEVEVGIIKLRVSLHDLRILSPGEAAPDGQKKPGKAAPSNKPQRPQPYPGARTPPPPALGGGGATPPAAGGGIGLTLPTSLNTVDVRGKDRDDAIQQTWNFVDRALLRGEPAVVVIHGHGEGLLKQALRDALRHDCPYDVRWRGGLDQEGGDGVTIIALKV